MPYAALRAKIEAYSIPEPNSGCWLWTGSCNRDGYGRLTHSHRTVDAHRLSWLAHRGPIPDGLWVLHACDVPSCVNPDHLWLGTNSDNQRDCTTKGRRRRQQAKGATYIARSRLWQAQISLNGRDLYLGTFRTQAEASGAYRIALAAA